MGMVPDRHSRALVANLRPTHTSSPLPGILRPPNAGKDGFWPTAAVSLHSRPKDRVCGMTKNIEKAHARPQAATSPYAPARMSTVETQIKGSRSAVEASHIER